jgi:hypothetical protein
MENAGDMLKCSKCFSVVKVPELKAPPAAMPPSDQTPANTGGQVEDFGAYSKSAEANWVDPAELVRRVAEEAEQHAAESEINLEVPEHVRRRHERLKKRRKQQTLIFTIVIVIVVAAVLGLMFYLQDNETASRAIPGGLP